MGPVNQAGCYCPQVHQTDRVSSQIAAAASSNQQLQIKSFRNYRQERSVLYQILAQLLHILKISKKKKTESIPLKQTETCLPNECHFPTSVVAGSMSYQGYHIKSPSSNWLHRSQPHSLRIRQVNNYRGSESQIRL